MDTLHPCPFCGGPASLTHDGGNEVWNQSWQAGCTCCSIYFKAWGSNSWASNKREDELAKASVIERWNTRA